MQWQGCAGRRLVVHADVDAFYVACELSRRPELRGQPVAVSQNNSGGFVAVSDDPGMYEHPHSIPGVVRHPAAV